MPIILNKKGTKAQIIANVTETISVDDLGIGDEVVTGFSITGAYWSCPAGSVITVERGADTVLNLSGSGRLPLYQDNISINIGETEDMVVTVPADATVIIEVRKISTFTTEYYGK